MPIYDTILARGYFPKELPPAFYTDQFAQFARTATGRATLAHPPAKLSTSPIRYRVARVGLVHRDFRIAHPQSFYTLTRLIARNFSKLLKLSGRSSFSRSRPVFAAHKHRAIDTAYKPKNLSREKANARAGALFLLKADIAQFYPSLYTHAVAWCVSPSTIKRENRYNAALGNTLDAAIRSTQGLVSQGIQIGSDISFLVGEIVLNRIDKSLKDLACGYYRWFDDYELSFYTRDEAERALAKLTRELEKYRLRLNPAKTYIVPLPEPTDDEWYATIKARSRWLTTERDFIDYFDVAYRMSHAFQAAPVLKYTVGLLFKISAPRQDVGRIAESAISQIVLREPGAAQKAFSLLRYWSLNGYNLNDALWSATVGSIVLKHESSGANSDVAWALAFALEQSLGLDKRASKVLEELHDDVTGLMTLDLHARNLLHPSFSAARIERALANIDLDGEHWLLGYESCRQGFLNSTLPAVTAHRLFGPLHAAGVSFYRRQMPSYASVIHPGGSPEWIARQWIHDVLQNVDEETRLPLLELIRGDVNALHPRPDVQTSHDEIVAALLASLEPPLALGPADDTDDEPDEYVD